MNQNPPLRILYVLEAVQHPSMRGSLRHHYFLRELARRYSVTLLALSRTPVTPQARSELDGLLESFTLFEVPHFDHRGGRLRRLAAARRAIRHMRTAFRRMARTGAFDVVLFHGKDVHRVIRGFRDLPVVADSCDATSLRLRERMRYCSLPELPWRWWRYREILRAERDLRRRVSHLIFISQRDRDAVAPGHPTAQVIPNGVDQAYWHRTSCRSDAPVLIFTGVMNYAPNADAAMHLLRSILPFVQSAVPDVETLIVGRDPEPALLEEARRQRGVIVTGFVDDLRPYLERASVFVAPLRYASGLQNKVLEAFAMELPVVTTPVVEGGLRVEGGDQPPVTVASDPREFADRVVELFRNPAKRNYFALAGLRFVRNHFNWDRSAAMLESICYSAASTAQRPIELDSTSLLRGANVLRP